MQAGAWRTSFPIMGEQLPTHRTIRLMANTHGENWEVSSIIYP